MIYEALYIKVLKKIYIYMCIHGAFLAVPLVLFAQQPSRAGLCSDVEGERPLDGSIVARVLSTRSHTRGQQRAALLRKIKKPFSVS